MILTAILVKMQEQGVFMADYKRMYLELCTAADCVIGPLEKLPTARGCAAILRAALLRAEEIYIDSSFTAVPEDAKILRLTREDV